ncbi:MAG: hypothetical protein ABJC13_07250 [Acidobacteriota bacterium]
MRRHALLACLAFGLAPHLGAQVLAPYLVADINTQTDAMGSDPMPIGSIGGRALLLVGQRRELWSSDGSEAGTTPLVQTAGFLAFAATPGGRFAFLREPVGEGYRPWVSDGTPAGTYPLSVAPFAGSFMQFQRRWLHLPGTDRIYFGGDRDGLGYELWTTDGTAGGTRLVADLAAGPDGSEPHELTLFRGRVYFAADDGRGDSLWTTNGTTNGTRLISDPDPQSRQSNGPRFLKVVGQTLFYFLERPDGWSLWKSDGTKPGTRQIARLPVRPSSQFDLPQGVSHLGKLFFIAEPVTGGGGAQLWASDGTAAGTRAVASFPTGDPLAFRLSAIQPAGQLLFAADEPVRGRELWTTNGLPGGARLLKDICPGPCDGLDFEPFLEFGGRLWLRGSTPAQGIELWTTDGTTAGTRLFKDLCPGSCSARPRQLGLIGATLYLSASDGQAEQLWRTTGTPAGTVRLTQAPNALGGILPMGAVAGAAFLFSGTDPVHGRELWKTTGTVASTGLLADLADDPSASSNPHDLVRAGTRAIFLADDGVHTGRIWSSDGTTAGTRRLPFETGEFAEELGFAHAVAAEHFAYLYRGAIRERALWRSDGTTAGTFPVTPPGLRESPDGVAPLGLGDRAYFVGTDTAHGEELWATDGTAASTHLVAESRPGPQGSRPDHLEPFLGGQLLFEASDELINTRPYVTNGTAASTRLLEEAYPFLGEVGEHTLAGNKFFFLRPDATLWVSDGTAAGTLLVSPEGVQSLALFAAGGKVLFSASSGGETYLGVYVSDGTAAGTKLVGSDFALVQNLAYLPPVGVGSRVLFTAYRLGDFTHPALWVTGGTPGTTFPLIEPDDSASLPTNATPFAGRLLLRSNSTVWLTDGTPAGTTVELPPDPGSGPAPILTVAGERAFFARFSPEAGVELWALRVP